MTNANDIALVIFVGGVFIMGIMLLLTMFSDEIVKIIRAIRGEYRDK